MLVQVTRVPALIVSRLGLNGPPPPVIATLEIEVASQVGCGLGLGDTPGVGEALGLGETPGVGDALGLGDVPGVGNGLGLGDGFGPPVTVTVERTPLRASSIW